MMSRGARRTLSLGLQTVLGVAKKGYFIPDRNAAASSLFAHKPFEALLSHFRAAEPTFSAHLSRIDALAEALSAMNGPAPEPRFNQTWFPRLDAAALVALIHHMAPARIVEVGSGHSTRFMARAIRDGGLPTALTAIDPKPRADLAGLPLTLKRTTVQDAGLAPFEHITAGDVVMVDSSHVLMPGSDVDVMLNHVIPSLPAGVILGFHDIFLPAPYPNAWPFTIYNEQNAVASLIGGRAELVFASAYVTGNMAEAVASSWVGRQPLEDGARESLLLLKLVR